MRELSVGECKQRQIEVLEKIDAFCTEHGLAYVLAFGTLIGAIRHNGYIPWDDDVDIMMPRADYEVFCRQFSAEGTKLLSVETVKDYPYPFAKVIDSNTVLFEAALPSLELGVYIDVFPMDYTPEEEKKHKAFCRKVDFWNRAWLYKGVTKEVQCDMVHRMYHTLFRIMTCTMTRQQTAAKVEKLIRKYAAEKSENVSCYTFRRGCCWELPYESYFSTEKHVFENRMFNIPKAFDAVLTKIYGNYMELPPIEQRKSGHIFKAYEKAQSDMEVQ